MSATAGPSASTTGAITPPHRKGLRGFLQGPTLVDHKGFWFVLIIFLVVIVLFGVAFYEFMVTLQPIPTAPVKFDAAYMSGGNGTFNVTDASNASWPWQNFTVNLTVNNFGAVAVPLAPSGVNATLLLGPSTHKDYYRIIWVDRDHNGRVSVGDAFWVTGNGVPLPQLSYVEFSLIWNHGAWASPEYFVTSSAIV